MKKVVRLGFGLLISLSVPVVSLAQETPDIQEGLWEVNSQMTVTGMPMNMPKMTIQRCYTKQSMSPENILQQNNCQMKSMDLKANSARWAMRCEQEGMKMQSIGSIQYQKTSFTGSFQMTMSGAPQGGVSMQTQLTGRYIGKCK